MHAIAESGAAAHARGELERRRGDLVAAEAAFELAASLFDRAGEPVRAAEALVEREVTVQRRDRSLISASIERLRVLAKDAAPSIFVRATTVIGSGHVARGESELALVAFSEAFERSEGLLHERVRVLNSFGTLLVALGSFGAAKDLLEHAAEVATRIGATESAAIAHGQLGAIALGRGDLDEARRHFGGQELLATAIGDTFGRSRALAYLAEVALEAGQPEVARDIARRCIAIAGESAMFASYAERIELAASRALGEDVEERLRALRERFSAAGNRLGAALADADRNDEAALARAMETFASFGLTARLARMLECRGDSLLVAALAELHPHLASTHELALVYSRPAAFAAIGARRAAGQRNLARLGRLRHLGAGLAVAAVVGWVDEAGKVGAIAQRLDDVAIVVYASSVDRTTLERELAGTKAIVVRSDTAMLADIPFPGDVGVRIDGIALFDLAGRARALATPGVTFE